MKSKVLGNCYEVEQQLGKRAGRRTLLARDRETQELVFVKVLAFGRDIEWDDLKLFEREAETLKSLIGGLWLGADFRYHESNPKICGMATQAHTYPQGKYGRCHS